MDGAGFNSIINNEARIDSMSPSGGSTMGGTILTITGFFSCFS